MRDLKPLFIILALLTWAICTAAAVPSQEYKEHIESGQRWLSEERYDQAIEEFEQAEALAPGELLDALYGLDAAYEKTDRPREAITAWRSFIKSATDSELQARAYHHLGIWRLREGKLRKGEKAFRKALELRPQKTQRIRLSLAETLYQAGKDAAALAVLEAYPKREPPDSWKNLPVGPVSDRTYDQLTELLLAAGGDTPVYFQGSVSKPEKISAPLPQYTRIAHRKRIQGHVIVRTIIDKNGAVANVEVLKGLPYGLNEESVKAIRQWRFRAATFRGEPVALYFNVTVNFRLGPQKGGGS